MIAFFVALGIVIALGLFILAVLSTARSSIEKDLEEMEQDNRAYRAWISGNVTIRELLKMPMSRKLRIAIRRIYRQDKARYGKQSALNLRCLNYDTDIFNY